MICDPHWTSYLSALLIPIVAVLGIYIAYRQWQTNQNRLKLDLFEKRWRVYQQLIEFLRSNLMPRKVSKEEPLKFFYGKHEARWLLSKKIFEHINEIERKAIELQELRVELKDILVRNKRRQNVQEQREIKNWLEVQLKEIGSHFEPFLKLSH